MTCICDLVQGLCGYNVDGDLLCCGNPSKPMRATTPRCDLGHAITLVILFQSHGDVAHCFNHTEIVCDIVSITWRCIAAPPSRYFGATAYSTLALFVNCLGPCGHGRITEDVFTAHNACCKKLNENTIKDGIRLSRVISLFIEDLLN